MLTTFLATSTPLDSYLPRMIVLGIISVLMLIAALVAIILVLIQPSNSDGVDALGGGSSDTFYGKNKGQSTEEKLKKWTIVCLVTLAVLAIAAFLIQALWR